MDDADVPMENRVLVVPPAVRKSLMGIDRYVSSDFVGGRGVESGLIGNLYGVDIYVSSNAPVIEASGQNSASTADTRGCLFFHSRRSCHGRANGCTFADTVQAGIPVNTVHFGLLCTV